MVNAGGHLTGWVYDNLNRQTEERRYDGVFTTPPAQLPGNPAQLNQVRYDEEGNRVGITDGNNQVYSYTPDALGREIRGNYPQPLNVDGFALSETRRTFDDLDHLVSVSETKGTIVQTRTLQWDYLGRQTQETSPYGAVLSFEYDDNGNRTKSTLTLPNLAPKVVQYGYDARNRLASVTDATGVTTYEYGTGSAMGARPNRVWKVHHPDGSVETNSYDLADRLLSKTALDKDGHLLVSYAYTYDDAGRKLTQTEDHGQGAGNEVTTYAYDNAGRLASETLRDAAGNQISSHAYTYDSAGNRLTETTTDASNAPASSKAYTYNELEQLVSMSDSVTGTSVQYAYDNNGNQTQKVVTKDAKTITTEFQYTTRDQLRTVIVDGATKEDLLYDDLGRRIRKNGELEHWDGRSLVAETDAASGGLLRGYTHGLSLLRENVLGNMVEAYTDGMGSVGALVPQNGTAANAGHYRYDAYGNFRTSAHPGDCSADPSGLTCNAPLTYTGHLYDAESNLFYFGARYYDPETGRFLTNDPVAGDALNPPSLHKYLYAYDSPMVFTDPWGEYIDNGDGSTLQTDSDFLYKVTGGMLGDKYKDNQSLASVVSAVKCATSKNGAYAAMGTPELKNALSNWRTKEGGVDQQSVAMIDFYFHRFFDNLQQQDNYGFVLDEAHQTHGVKGELTPQAAAGLGILSGLGKAVVGVITAPITLVKAIENAPDEMRREIEMQQRGQNPMRGIALRVKAQIEDTLQAASEDPYKAGGLFGGALGTAATLAAPYAKVGEVAEAAKVAAASRSIVVKEPWEIPGYTDLAPNSGPINIPVPAQARSLGAAAANDPALGAAIGTEGNPASRVIKVIGRRSDTGVAKAWPGHDVLDLPDAEWTMKKNMDWIDEGIAKKEPFYTASPEANNMIQISGPYKGQPTIYALEIQRVKDAGYVKRGDYYLHPDGTDPFRPATK
jgi:RHS repeat-associated protein